MNVIQPALEQTVERFLGPHMEFSYMKEQGLRIWNKKDNIAFQKTTIITLLDNLRSICPENKFQETLRLSGTQAAYYFFDEFAPILTIEGSTLIPPNLVNFLKLITTFDYRSGWWDKPGVADIEEEGDSIIAIELRKPWWRYPHLDPEIFPYNDFISYYLLTLCNCASDYRRVWSHYHDRVAKNVFAYYVKCPSDAPSHTSWFRISVTETYVEDYLNIDKNLLLLSYLLMSTETPERINKALIELFEKLLALINENFNESIKVNEKTFDELKIAPFKLHPSFVQGFLRKTLTDIRVKYQNFRIKKLGKEISNEDWAT